MSDAQFDAVIANVTALTREAIVTAAKREHHKIMDEDPRPLSFVRHVDGVENAPEERVKPGGVIVYDYDRLDYVVSVALDYLRQYSPVREGDYVRSHTLFLNGQPVDDVKAWKRGDKIAIANTMPYARKIERGGKQYRTHPHVYEKTERVLDRRFGNLSRVYFGYMEVTIGDVADWAKSTKLTGGGRTLRSKTRDEWLRRQPALFIFPA